MLCRLDSGSQSLVHSRWFSVCAQVQCPWEKSFPRLAQLRVPTGLCLAVNLEVFFLVLTVLACERSAHLSPLALLWNSLHRVFVLHPLQSSSSTSVFSVGLSSSAVRKLQLNGQQPQWMVSMHAFKKMGKFNCINYTIKWSSHDYWANIC